MAYLNRVLLILVTTLFLVYVVSFGAPPRQFHGRGQPSNLETKSRFTKQILA